MKCSVTNIDLLFTNSLLLSIFFLNNHIYSKFYRKKCMNRLFKSTRCQKNAYSPISVLIRTMVFWNLVKWSYIVSFMKHPVKDHLQNISPLKVTRLCVVEFKYNILRNLKRVESIFRRLSN